MCADAKLPSESGKARVIGMSDGGTPERRSERNDHTDSRTLAGGHETGVGAMWLPALASAARTLAMLLLVGGAIVAHVILVPIVAVVAWAWHWLRGTRASGEDEPPHDAASR